MKNNRTLNQEHERRTAERVRPKPTGNYEFEALEAVIRQWITEAK